MKCDNEEALGRLIYMTGQSLKNFAEKVLNPFEVTLEQFHILKCLVLADTGLTQKQIGEEVSKSPANTTRILDRLENKNLITRKNDPSDRRASLVGITREGSTLVSEVSGNLESFSENLVEGVSEEDQQVIRCAFRKISENIIKMSQKL